MTESKNINLENLGKYVKVTCPICHKEKKIIIPKIIINHSPDLATISVPDGLVCDHHFQLFIDKDFNVRGYQKVDYQCELELINEIELHEKSDEDLLKNLKLDGNHLEYIPQRPPSKQTKIKPIPEIPTQDIKVPTAILTLPKRTKKPDKRKEKTDAEIYEEFWELITDENEHFREFIEKDTKRRTNSSFLFYLNSINPLPKN